VGREGLRLEVQVQPVTKRIKHSELRADRRRYFRSKTSHLFYTHLKKNHKYSSCYVAESWISLESLLAAATDDSRRWHHAPLTPEVQASRCFRSQTSEPRDGRCKRQRARIFQRRAIFECVALRCHVGSAVAGRAGRNTVGPPCNKVSTADPLLGAAI